MMMLLRGAVVVSWLAVVLRARPPEDEESGSALYRKATMPFLRVFRGDRTTLTETTWETSVLVHIYNVVNWEAYCVCVRVGTKAACFDAATGVRERVKFDNPTFRAHSVLELGFAIDTIAETTTVVEAQLVFARRPPLGPQLSDAALSAVGVLSRDAVTLSADGSRTARPSTTVVNADNPFVRHVQQSLADAERAALSGEFALPPFAHAMEGLVSSATRELFHAVVTNWPTRPAVYLEVGVYRGASLCAAAYGNDAHVFGVDDWSFQANRQLAVANLERCQASRTDPIHVLEGDAFDLLPSLPPRLDVFFYDGGHEALDQFRALLEFEPLFADTVLVVVDDYHEAAVYDATELALDLLLSSLHWSLLFQSSAYLSTTAREANAILLLQRQQNSDGES